MSPTSPADAALMAEKIAHIAATADEYPGVVISEYLRPPGVAFMSAWGLTWLGTTLHEMQALGPAYQAAYFILPEAQDYLAEVMCTVPGLGTPPFAPELRSNLWNNYHTAAPAQRRQYGALCRKVQKAYKR